MTTREESNEEHSQTAKAAQLRRLQALERLNSDICESGEVVENVDRQLRIENPKHLVQKTNKSSAGIRIAVFVLIFLLFCTQGVMATVGSLIELVTKGGGRHLYTVLAVGLAGSYAWIAYFVMGINWINNRRLGEFWPVSGTVAGVIALSPIPAGALFVLPAVALAGYMVIFHTSKSDSPSAIVEQR
jgi:hypothetical protein